MLLKENKEKCECAICRNAEMYREERQFASLMMEDYSMTIAAEEFGVIDKLVENAKNVKKVKQEKGSNGYPFPLIEVQDDIKPVIVYGVLLRGKTKRNKSADMGNLVSMAMNHKNYRYITVENDQVYESVYEDAIFFPQNKVLGNSIPFAMLLYSTLDVKPGEFGFGHVMTLYYADLDLVENILNREFLLVVRDREHTFNGDVEHWKKYINQKVMLENAKQIY